MEDSNIQLKDVSKTKAEYLIHIDSKGKIVDFTEEAEGLFSFGDTIEKGLGFFNIAKLDRQDFEALLMKVLNGTIVVTKILYEGYNGKKQTQAVFRPVSQTLIEVKIYP